MAMSNSAHAVTELETVSSEQLCNGVRVLVQTVHQLGKGKQMHESVTRVLETLVRKYWSDGRALFRTPKVCCARSEFTHDDVLMIRFTLDRMIQALRTMSASAPNLFNPEGVAKNVWNKVVRLHVLAMMNVLDGSSALDSGDAFILKPAVQLMFQLVQSETPPSIKDVASRINDFVDKMQERADKLNQRVEDDRQLASSYSAVSLELEKEINAMDPVKPKVDIPAHMRRPKDLPRYWKKRLAPGNIFTFYVLTPMSRSEAYATRRRGVDGHGRQPIDDLDDDDEEEDKYLFPTYFKYEPIRLVYKGHSEEKSESHVFGILDVKRIEYPLFSMHLDVEPNKFNLVCAMHPKSNQLVYKFNLNDFPKHERVENLRQEAYAKDAWPFIASTYDWTEVVSDANRKSACRDESYDFVQKNCLARVFKTQVFDIDKTDRPYLRAFWKQVESNQSLFLYRFDKEGNRTEVKTKVRMNSCGSELNSSSCVSVWIPDNASSNNVQLWFYPPNGHMYGKYTDKYGVKYQLTSGCSLAELVFSSRKPTRKEELDALSDSE